jgi:hypothetical protein
MKITLTLPSSRIPITQSGEPISADWMRWAHDVTARLGGPTGQSIDELVMQQFDDAGVAEQQAEIYSVIDAIGQLPARLDQVEQDNQRLSGELEELRGTVLVLTALLEGFQQGTLQ